MISAGSFRRLLTLLFLFCFAFGVTTVCDAKQVKVGFVHSGETINDSSFNEMAVAGLRRLQKEQQVQILPRRGGFTTERTLEAVSSLLSEEVRIMVINGAPIGNRFGEVALDHPEVIFILTDSRIEGYPNIISIDYAQGMGSCLVGALCAWQTKTGRVGFIGGNELPVIKEFLKGFREGVKYSGRDVEVDVQYVRKGNAEKGFEDPQQANILASRMYGAGVDIIFAVAGLSGNGVIQAARNSGNLAVGVDSDQDHMAKGSVLTSMMKRLDIAVYKEVLAVLNGTHVPGRRVYDLSNEGVCLTEMKYSKHLIAPDVLEKLHELKAKLVSGKVKLNPSAE
ncbi:BMP family protein [Desulfovibrio sp. JC010]|uniref:BMP family lipoprotein n=1 Tax=Desulfovibrio sp. JC010 TaxID=2593641 RepID=UPI0013D009A5|nr:BMP family ABC transporter substrate-binding protein [Desulfovibrio sp. JC010]NDV25768.1 BMP family ABC transporter substrate-binding protein [Desulfovibrio sp. JC010]